MIRQILTTIPSTVYWIATLAVVVTTYATPVVTLGLLVVIAGLYLYRLREKHYYLIFLVTSVGGPIGEMIAIYMGVWEYTLPHFNGIPYWLPVVWGMAGVSAVKIGEKLKQL